MTRVSSYGGARSQRMVRRRRRNTSPHFAESAVQTFPDAIAGKSVAEVPGQEVHPVGHRVGAPFLTQVAEKVDAPLHGYHKIVGESGGFQEEAIC